ncbi:hypothetical protein G4Y79_12840 [Phototrophicus methaneseepsis]|uniref:Glycosyltransferase RgtA/B/C/D-like domain-containing protein n=1 Tax=Phototrophicus methaneseepsis TaxID=2710758 RepID=A0A7S8E5D5_9CHLR|nr:hypothetical protein [Phototrophicus methaneseepsis]QPC80599.1 hypothetical protein G4Y79_12840 [Phototrophicus methaneseepsis]
MQSTYTGYVGRAEWRWVSVVTALVVILTTLPYLVVAFYPSSEHFLGVLYHYQDGAVYLSKMMQGAQGAWLVHFQHTPEPHLSALIYPIYIILGQLARLSFIPIVLVFHVVRLLSMLVMCSALYQLGASIWVKVRARRIFFIIVMFGSGFGWLVAIVSGGDFSTPDLTMPSIYPLYASIVNVHYPLTIAFLALLATVFVHVFRPGFEANPTVDNGGAIAFLVGIVLAFLYQEALLAIVVAVIGSTLAQWILQRKVTAMEYRWALWFIVPSLPIVLYYIVVSASNSAVELWLSQRTGMLPSLPLMLLGFGLPLILAIPGLVRALRRFEPDGDRFMLLWIFSMVVSCLVSTNGRANYLAGLMIPLAYFATRAIEDFWFKKIVLRRAYQQQLYIVFVPLIALTNIFVLLLPVHGVLQNQPIGAFVSNDYREAFRWLADHTTTNQVVLAAPDVGTWVPVEVGARAYYGHPIETLHARQRLGEVNQFYSAESVDDCIFIEDADFIQQNQFLVPYVLFGPQEAAIGTPPCLNDFVLVTQYGNVEIYATQFASANPE